MGVACRLTGDCPQAETHPGIEVRRTDVAVVATDGLAFAIFQEELTVITALEGFIDDVRSGGLIAYPTDSCFALGCSLGNKEGMERIREIRHLDERHPFTLMCRDFTQLGQFVQINNSLFRSLKAATPGPYTFILPATKEVPRRLLHPKKKTVGVRIPDHVVAQALLEELGDPLLSSTLLMPGESEPMTDGWQVKEELDHWLDAVIDAGPCGSEPTTVVDFSDGLPVVARVGAGDTTTCACSTRFEWNCTFNCAYEQSSVSSATPTTQFSYTSDDRCVPMLSFESNAWL